MADQDDTLLDLSPSKMTDDAVAAPLTADILGRMDPVQAARKGLPPRALDRVSDALFGASPTADDTRLFARALGVSERTISRRKTTPSEPLPSPQSDRLLLLAETYDLAVQALEGEDRARAWLTRPHRLLDGESPVARLDTLAGVREVQAMLYHVEYGMAA